MTRCRSLARMLSWMGLAIAFVALYVVIGALLAWLFTPQPVGLVAISWGISEAVVEGFVLVTVLFVAWRIWRFARRRRVGSQPSR